MSGKRTQVETFIANYNEVSKQSNILNTLNNTLSSTTSLGYEGYFILGDNRISLSEISGLSHEELFSNFEEELQLFMQFLISKNQARLEELLDSVAFDGKAEEPEIITEEETEKKPEYPSPTVAVSDFLQQYTSGDIVNTGEVFDELHEKVPNLSLSDIHKFCRDQMEEGKMSMVHKASCHKCTSGFSKVYEALPKTVICGDCGEDIVNIEIQYRIV